MINSLAFIRALVGTLILAASMPTIAADADTTSTTGTRATKSAKPDPVRRANAFERALVGVWTSEDISGGAIPGTLTLTSKLEVTLQPHPIGTYALRSMSGTWTADLATIRIQIPQQGEAELGYVLRDAELTLHYSNGLTQTFHRPTEGTKPSREIVLP